jgi:hypothetical protein
VRVKYGWPCRRAIAQLARIESAAATFAAIPDAHIAVDAFED